jgi:hypothetical protein
MLISACHSFTKTATDCTAFRTETPTTALPVQGTHVYKLEGYIIFTHSRQNDCRLMITLETPHVYKLEGYIIFTHSRQNDCRLMITLETHHVC